MRRILAALSSAASLHVRETGERDGRTEEVVKEGAVTEANTVYGKSSATLEGYLGGGT